MHGDVRKEQLIAPNVNACLVQFMTEQDLIYVERNGSPAVFNEDGLNWTVLYCQHSHRAGGSPILRHHPTPWQLNYWDLIQSAKCYSAVQVGESETELLVFLAPRNKIIAGFLPGQAPCVHRHLCLHFRLWAGFSSANEEDLVDIDNILREACWINRDGEVTTGHIPGNCPLHESNLPARILNTVVALQAGGSVSASGTLLPSMSLESSNINHAVKANRDDSSSSATSTPFSVTSLLPSVSPEPEHQSNAEHEAESQQSLYHSYESIIADAQHFRRIPPDVYGPQASVFNALADTPPHPASARGPNVEAIATAMWDRFIALANGDHSLEESMESQGVTLHNFTMEGLHSNLVLMSIISGDQGAMGRGVWTEVLHLIEQKIIMDDENWQQLGFDRYFTLKLQDFEDIPYPTTDIRHFRAIGLFRRLALMWQVEPVAISPMMVAYLISESMEVSISLNLLTQVAPDLNHRILQWPPTAHESISFISVPFQLVSRAFSNNYTVAQLRGLSTQQINALTPKIREAIAFNTRPRQFQMAHLLVKAITEGINITLHHNTSSLYSTVFDSEPEQLQDYLISAWTGRHVQSWQDVVRLFDIQYIESAGREYLARERGFMAELLRFLQKSVFNCRLFLVAVTGSPYVPVVVSGSPSKFHISFRTYLAHEASAFFHSCSKQVDILHSEETSAMFLSSFPNNLEESTLFDSWLLALIGDGDFNNL
ncbi:hypothetical protein F5876DRAFT_79325 [Lentinula aff. lateritia]|uniref:Uncharacterized protein n=1 Tax=Lentinula aff. lateritia TaxID=2804960 RepID=A0ACC1TT12_9AGAR|nr:hypothetical protein F5876DRAFT_79325 [Lentinula aff. lateritia]